MLEALYDMFHYQWKRYTIKPRLQERERGGEGKREEKGVGWGGRGGERVRRKGTEPIAINVD